MSSTGELGDYRLGRRIAVGGMAEIFEATRRDGAGPPLVLKRLLPQYARDAEVVRMLEHEGELVRRLVHPRLVRVVDVVAHGEEPFLVLERVDGLSADVLVDALVDRKRSCTLPMALALVLPLLDALAFVHDAGDEDGRPLGIVHRDVTPHNVLVSRDGSVKLGDFGIARSSMRDARTRTGVIKGKLRYLAPEQVTGSALDARTDIYAVGALLFELLAGEPYLRGSSEVELLRAAEESRYRPLGDLVDGVDPRLEKILRRCLSRFAEQRPKRADALRDELAALVDDAQLERGRAEWAELVGELAPALAATERTAEEAASPRGGPRERGAELEARPRGRARRFLTAAAVLVLTGAGVAAAILAWSRPQVSPVGSSGVAANPGPTLDEPGDPVAGDPIAGDPIAGDPIAGDPIAGDPVAGDPVAGSPAATPPASEGQPNEEPERVPERSATPRRVAASEMAAGSPPEASPSAAPALDGARNELAALRRELASRGILESDLRSDQRRALGAVSEALDRSDPDAARRALDPLAFQLRAIAVDETFVRAKLERVDARIRAARAAGVDTREVERLGALALQDLLERRSDATNRRLNEMLALLRAR